MWTVMNECPRRLPRNATLRVGLSRGRPGALLTILGLGPKRCQPGRRSRDACFNLRDCIACAEPYLVHTAEASVRGVTGPHFVLGTLTVSKLSLAKCLQPQTLFWPRGCDLLGQ